MTIQEFSRELSQPQHPSPLIQTLQTMRRLEEPPVRWSMDWYPWMDHEPGDSDRQPELHC